MFIIFIFIIHIYFTINMNNKGEYSYLLFIFIIFTFIIHIYFTINVNNKGEYSNI